MAYILAIDPGKATGVAHLNEGEFSSYILNTSDMYNFLVGVLELHKIDLPDVIVCEDYIVTQQTITKSRQNYSLELIGTLRFICDWRNIKFVLQTPAQAKSFATDAKLKKLGWYKPGAGHDNDAARHLLVYAVNHGLIDVKELV